MKLSATLSALSLFAAFATASNLFQQLASAAVDITASSGSKVPGESPLEYCEDTHNHILELEKINLIPNPPIPGQPLTIEAFGTLTHSISQGAMVEVTVKYGLITIYKSTLDLCDHAKEIDMECPVAPGKLILKKAVDIPKPIPAGKYTVTAKAYIEGSPLIPITCLTAHVAFTVGR
ncbi:Phosphatidylglycerol/phosphatidylinositol transfer protein [Maublancomyces gigas]|uniref:Phosphatidylglycerol/phosphatidylinositol transfer protein n=1 Tax=Discina gigas TaxID=1032678 RepID=A0ABR3GPE9_9PEZI